MERHGIANEGLLGRRNDDDKVGGGDISSMRWRSCMYSISCHLCRYMLAYVLCVRDGTLSQACEYHPEPTQDRLVLFGLIDIMGPQHRRLCCCVKQADDKGGTVLCSHDEVIEPSNTWSTP